MTDSCVIWYITAKAEPFPFYGRLKFADWAIVRPPAVLSHALELEFKCLMREMREHAAAEGIAVDWSTLDLRDDPIVQLQWPERSLQRKARRLVPAISAVIRHYLIPAEREKP